MKYLEDFKFCIVKIIIYYETNNYVNTELMTAKRLYSWILGDLEVDNDGRNLCENNGTTFV